MTVEHHAVEDVSRDADAEDDGIEVATENVIYGNDSLKCDNVIRIVPRNKVVCVAITFAATVVDLNLHYSRRCFRTLASFSLVLVSDVPFRS